MSFDACVCFRSTDSISDHVCISTSIHREEMIRRYPDIMVGMGSAKQLGQVGPDDRDLLEQVSIKVCVFL